MLCKKSLGTMYCGRPLEQKKQSCAPCPPRVIHPWIEKDEIQNQMWHKVTDDWIKLCDHENCGVLVLTPCNPVEGVYAPSKRR
jgi:hypothetical protein